MFKNIIVPIDLDKAEKGEAMLGQAKQLADQGAKVTVMNVVEDVPGLITAELPDGLVAKAAHGARGKLVDMVNKGRDDGGCRNSFGPTASRDRWFG